MDKRIEVKNYNPLKCGWFKKYFDKAWDKNMLVDFIHSIV